MITYCRYISTFNTTDQWSEHNDTNNTCTIYNGVISKMDYYFHGGAIAKPLLSRGSFQKWPLIPMIMVRRCANKCIIQCSTDLSRKFSYKV